MQNKILNGLKKVAKAVSDKRGIFTFFRAQLTSQLSGATDFIVTIALANVLAYLFHKPEGFYVLRATFFGQVCGGITNCFVNYRWTFKTSDVKKRYIVLRFLPVWVGSLLLNTAGTVFLTDLLTKLPWIMDHSGPLRKNMFIVPKLVVSILVGFVWNYNMHRLFVYRNLNLKRFFNQITHKTTDNNINN